VGRRTLVVVVVVAIVTIDRTRRTAASSAEKTHWIRIEETTELLSFRELNPIACFSHFLLYSALCHFVNALGGIVPRFTAPVLFPLSPVFAFVTKGTTLDLVSELSKSKVEVIISDWIYLNGMTHRRKK
jgi:hypothetical protein